MKNTEALDKAKLWKSIRHFVYSDNVNEKKGLINFIRNETTLNIDDNKIIYKLNKFINCHMDAEKILLSASRKLLTDFSSAESEVKEAIRMVSGKHKKYNIFEHDIEAYFQSSHAAYVLEQRKKGETIDHPEEIKLKQKFIKDAKIQVNSMANLLMVESAEFRDNRMKFIKTHLENQYGAKFVDRKGQIQFRAIRVEGDYGKPETAFVEGLAPHFVSIWEFQPGLINKPYVNDERTVTGEKIGWTGGITSTSANLKFCASFDFASRFGIQDGFIYIYSCGEAASVANHISSGVGYDGKVDISANIDRSNAEAAMEYILPYLSPECIIGAREIRKDGTLGQYFHNHNINKSAVGDTEYLKVMLCDTVNEIKLIEFLEGRSVEILYNNTGSYSKEMKGIFLDLSLERQKLVISLASSASQALEYNTTNLNPMDQAIYTMAQKDNITMYNNIHELQCGYKLEQEKHTDVRSHFISNFSKEKRSSSTLNL